MKNTDIGGQLLKGHLEMLLLSVLEDGPLHGYAMVERLRRRSAGVFQLPEGTIYPALHRLESAGLLVSEWSRHDGRRRREYVLSDAGREALAARTDEWTAFSDAVNSVIGRPALGSAT
jgi:DNA-binding PadR family transcriptional regulator